MATIAAVHDLAGVGRCSLVAAISALSALGHCCIPLPTAVLSQQTAFPGYTYLDFTPHMPAFLEGWRGLGVRPEVIYTGFLGGGDQIALLERWISSMPEALVVVDPVMADQGSVYPCYDDGFVQGMRRFARCAHILTPNPTEYLLLTGRAPDAPLADSDGELLRDCRSLGGVRLGQVVITGLAGDAGYENTVIDLAADRVHRIPCQHTGVAYSGTGDLFASLVCGFVAQGTGIVAAAERAGAFLSRVAVHMGDDDADPRYGLRYEPFLRELFFSPDEEVPS